MDKATAEESLRAFIHRTGVSTSTGGYLKRRDDSALKEWVRHNLVMTQDHRHPDFVFFYVTPESGLRDW